MRMIWKLVMFSLIVSIFIANIPQKVDASVSVSAASAVLIEQKSGRILYEKDAYTKRRIASITKIMTAKLAIESGKMNQYVKVSEQATRAEGSSVYLKPGEKIKLKDLVYGLMLRSGNDTAVAIAEYVGGSVEGFSYLMNLKAKEIGMLNTHFANPHGLDDREDHYSTAYDMAVLMRYAMQDKTFKKISGTKVYRAPNPTEDWDRIWKNKNRLLTKYKYTTGGKTGYTKRAKRTLVTSATKGDMSLIAVTLNGPDDWNDHISMYESGFKGFDMAEVLPEGKIEDVKNKYYKNHLYVKKAIVYPVTSEEMDLFSIKYKLNKPVKKFDNDKKNEKIVGKAAVYLDGRVVQETPIYYQNVPEQKKGLLDFVKEIFLIFIGVKSNG
ncbi:D-alanyl-D-alanine carboxypeptidase [Bacillus sp. ISL-40]|uniref:D-alanyl-D-alanine carboxypeptidase family protein n=1 Tax=unclassified Bacillus (in: firmicutes) TaxID=185979 RepID=UPI001BEA1F9B|nr:MULTISPECIES: D-alanyl-D-alanine carboxypeptidase family protein [unclassified Bacillus (in: firmicutes)]MBT2698888.1 D-alanyl-D-alanine carboxypeptidase [Bacillus sp. ISL-40]MBT2721663.1 D-alanyl-D-alanine carboxypeptidase [Bacillus sp. ISL-46]MBT2744540.1 D-alanyl-D-alanine carboxypeptidase [Bacillus sp. ISL-77]